MSERPKRRLRGNGPASVVTRIIQKLEERGQRPPFRIELRPGMEAAAAEILSVHYRKVHAITIAEEKAPR